MLNSVAAGRRLVLRAAVWQTAAVLLVALLFLLRGVPQAVAAAIGGLAIVVGALLAAWMAFGGGVLGAVSAVLRLVAGMVVKWVVVIGVLVMGAGLYKLPPLPLLAGVVAGFPAVDFVATLLDGSFHERDSSTLAFELAAMAAFREGFAKAAPQVLEPVMAVEVITPADYLGDAIGDLNRRRGQIQNMETKGKLAVKVVGYRSDVAEGEGALYLTPNGWVHIQDNMKMNGRAGGEPIAVLNHNRVMAYMVPADRYEAMMEQLDDLALVEIIKRRAEEAPLRVSLDEL